jgi:ABC-2 type transport system ATP-binding protein
MSDGRTYNDQVHTNADRSIGESSGEVSIDLSGTGSKQPLLVARGLGKTYHQSQTPALSNVDISIDEGEIFGLLGPNGAGKTTCISMLSTVLSPSTGQIIINGINARTNPNAVRKIIGLVPQDIALYETLSARENLAYFGRLHGQRGNELNEKIKIALSLVGLSGQIDQRVHTFSGGMKRRLNLAAGVLHQPRLLFLDEPTVGIDAQSRNLIMEQLQVLKQNHTTMLYTTHYMEEAQLLCDRIAIVDAGKIIAEGSPADLVTRETGCDNLEALFLKLTGKQLRD